MIGNDWDLILKDEFHKPYFIKLVKFLNEECKKKVIYPKNSDLFKALKETSYKDVKVVILGQDPYHGENEANGLCFSVNHGVRTPPSLYLYFIILSASFSSLYTVYTLINPILEVTIYSSLSEI